MTNQNTIPEFRAYKTIGDDKLAMQAIARDLALLGRATLEYMELGVDGYAVAKVSATYNGEEMAARNISQSDGSGLVDRGLAQAAAIRLMGGMAKMYSGAVVDGAWLLQGADEEMDKGNIKDMVLTAMAMSSGHFGHALWNMSLMDPSPIPYITKALVQMVYAVSSVEALEANLRNQMMSIPQVITLMKQSPGMAGNPQKTPDEILSYLFAEDVVKKLETWEETGKDPGRLSAMWAGLPIMVAEILDIYTQIENHTKAIVKKAFSEGVIDLAQAHAMNEVAENYTKEQKKRAEPKGGENVAG